MSQQEIKPPDNKQLMAYWLQKTSKYFQMSMGSQQDFQEAWNNSLQTIEKVFVELETEIKRLQEENKKLQEKIEKVNINVS